MLSPKYYFYLALNSEGQSKIGVTSNPRIDAYLLDQDGFCEMHLLQPPLPVWVAELVVQKVAHTPRVHAPAKFQKIISQLVNEIFPQKHFTLSRYLLYEIKPDTFDPPEIETLFWGRSLLGSEIPELLKANGVELPWDPEDWMQYLYFNGKIQREAAVSRDFLGIPFCKRCGATSDVVENDCIFCGSKHCFTCNNCQTMGLAKSCIPLYASAYPGATPNSAGKVEPQLDFDLTPPQQRASGELVKFLDSKEPQFLVWAVCGGGKTEVSFQVVARVLTDGGRVLFAIPRKDIVTELLPRFQKAFPGIEIIALYGGSGGRFADAPFIIATTHQCLRFYQRFDLVILDEADAFPYQGSEMLHFAVKRSVKPGGHMIIMTATPDGNMIRKAGQGKIPYVSIPARPHRKPLVVPDIVKIALDCPPNSSSFWEPPRHIERCLIEGRDNQRRFMIFLPTIKMIDDIGNGLVKWGVTKGLRGACAHAKSPNRDQVKEELLTGKIDYLITSTIFERGITIPNLDVFVLFADYETIFDARTLIQIAGRVSRRGEPAQVTFLAKTISRSMKDCCNVIASMNTEGYKLGFLD